MRSLLSVYLPTERYTKREAKRYLRCRWLGVTAEEVQIALDPDTTPRSFWRAKINELIPGARTFSFWCGDAVFVYQEMPDVDCRLLGALPIDDLPHDH
jgi:hypothetical protein